MTAKMYAPFLRKLCGTKTPSRYGEPKSVIKRRSSRQGGDDKRRTAGSEQWIQFGCLPIKKTSLPLAVLNTEVKEW